MFVEKVVYVLYALPNVKKFKCCFDFDLVRFYILDKLGTVQTAQP